MSSSSTPVSYPFAWDPPLAVPDRWRDLRDRSLVEVQLPSGDTALLVTRYRDVRALFSDRRLSRNTARYPTSRISPNNDLFGDPEIDSDPPRYLDERAIVTRAFSARRLEALRPLVWQVAGELMDAMDARPRPADLMEAFAFPLPIRIICHMLGVPPGDNDRFRALVDGFMSVTKMSAEEVERCRAGLWSYLDELIEAHRAAPGDDLISELIRVNTADPNALSDYQLQHWVRTLLIAGYVTTASQIGTSMAVLLNQPHIVEEIRQDFSLVPGAVEELLRFQLMGASLGSLRYALADIELSDGAVVPAGSTVMLSVESNMDDTVFESPFELDIRRTENHHMTFGSGIHYCAGAALARMELQVSTEGLLRRYPKLRLAVPKEELARPAGGFLAAFSAVPVDW